MTRPRTFKDHVHQAFVEAVENGQELERLRAAVAPFIKYYENIRLNLRRQPRPTQAAIEEHGETDAVVTWAQFYELNDAYTLGQSSQPKED